MECPIDPEDCNVPNAALRESEARFRNTFENAAVGMAHVLTEGRWLRVNQKVADILGYEPDELLETTFQVLTHPDDLDLDLGLLQQVVRGERDNYRIEKRYFRKSGETIWANLTVGCVRNESGGVEYFISVIEDITEQKRMHQALFESEARFRAFQQTTPDGFMILRSLRGPEGKIRDFVWDYANPAAERLSLRAAGYLPGKRLLEEMPSHARSGLLDAYKTVVETGSSWQGEQMFTREAGDVWVSITATRLGDGFAATLRDVTTRKKAEADQEMLLRELNHRVKNSLATVQAIASHTLRDARDLETFRESFMGRLRAIAACHDLLVATARDEANIFQLVRDQVTPYSPPGSDRVQMSGPPLILGANAAHAFGLVLHELATNAAKHGALSNDEGRVKISWERDISRGKREAIVVWEETGGPPVQEPARKGFGSFLIEHSLSHSLGGCAEIAYRPDGLKARFRFVKRDAE